MTEKIRLIGSAQGERWDKKSQPQNYISWKPSTISLLE